MWCQFGINGVIKMKKYTVKGILLAMGLVLVTLSMQAKADYIKYCCEIVDINKVVASYTSDTTFEIYIKAMENLHFWDTPADSSVFYKELIKNNGHYVNAEITLYDDDGTGTDEFKIVVSGLDFGSRIFFTWVDLVEMGKVVFKNYDYGRRRYERIEFEGTSDFSNGTSGGDNTGWSNLDAGIDVEESGYRWNKQKILVDAAKSEVLTALSVITNTIDTDVSILTKWTNYAVFTSKVKVHRTEFEKLARPHITAVIPVAHETVINNAIIDHQEYAYKSAEFMIKLEGFWHSQWWATDGALTTATKARANATLVMGSTVDLETKSTAVRQSNQYNAAFLVEIHALRILRMTDANDTIIAVFNVEHEALVAETTALEVTLAQAIEAKRVADLEVPWQNQLAITNTASNTAGNALTNVITVFASALNFPAKTAAIEASKQANTAFKVEIQALDAIKRNQDDGVIVATFNDQYQALKTRITELEVALAAAIEAKRVADLEAPWQAQLALTDSALATATSAEVDANNAVNSKGSFASKEAAITVLKEANAAFNVAIQALDSVKRNQADDTVVTGFNDQLQSLREKASALETLVAIEAKRVADLTNWDAQLTLTNTALATATTAVTNAISAMNDDNIDLTSKSTAIEASKQANVAFMSEIQVLKLVKRDEADATVITAFNDQHQMLNTQIAALEVALAAAIEAKRAADLAAPWLTQLALTNTALTTASNAVIEVSSVLVSTVDFPVKTAAIEASKQANEAFRLAIQALDAIKRDQDDGVTVTTFNNQHQALQTQITELEVALAAAIEAKRAADLSAPWQAQLALTDSALITANTVVANATSVMNSDAELSSKTTTVEASKQANAAFISAIQALKLVERDATDGAVTTAFNDQYQTLLTQTTALEATLAMAIEAKRVADLEASWQAQLIVTNSALQAATNARIDAETVFGQQGGFSVKSIALGASRKANKEFKEAIRSLEGFWQTQQHDVAISEFTTQHQTLLEQNNALEATLEASPEKSVFDEATLTGYWKLPVIKGLNYQTPTHPAGVTDETGAFKCQPDELVTFSIESLALTTTTCVAILETKTTKSVSLNVASTGDGFKDWQDEEGKQVIITKVLFGLFNDNIKTAFAQADEALKFITVKLTEVQKGNTANQSLDANDLSVMVQDVLGTTEAVVLPTTEQATNMVTSGWQANKVFDAVDTKDKADTEDKADTDASKKSSSGGGCVYNPNATGRADVGFILLMVLSVYYLVRRKRLTT